MIAEEELRWALQRLENIGQRLKVLAFILLTFTLANIALMFSYFGQMFYLNHTMTAGLSMILTSVMFFMALYFDSLRKDGRSFYDEITGVLHQTSKMDSELSFRNDSIMARVSIKKFINSVDIPLLPGNSGPGLLILANVVTTMTIVMFRF
ncbi:hypothetical protein RU080_00470 [Shewanella algae]|uniref:hypothetical protein n=1 Tax=Shewanella algae TaxID=38313 RepID=UPI002936AF83|nr:hypothetical protein [Shewanella algae]MDV2960220.1 hypothetical protein [Shewanella algae]